VFKRRFLIVKRTENVTKREWEDLARTFDYLPELRVLRRFCADVDALFDPDALARVGRRRRTVLVRRG
jgi:hypothetical protein